MREVHSHTATQQHRHRHTQICRYTDTDTDTDTDTQPHTPTHSHSGGTEQHQQGSHSPCVLEQRQCAIKVTGLDECLRELLD